MPEAEAQNKPEAVEQVTALLRPEAPSSGSEPEPKSTSTRESAPTEETEPDTGVSELTPSAIAEKLGIKPSELFAQLRIPVDDGESLSLEEFKDNGKGLRDVITARNEVAEEKVAFENQVMLQRQTLQAAIGKIPKDVLTPELIEGVQQEHKQYVSAERIALQQIRPDLKDPAKWGSVRDLLITHLKPYGFYAIEVDAIIDHRLAKYVIDNAEREQRIAQIDLDSKDITKQPLTGAAKSLKRTSAAKKTETVTDTPARNFKEKAGKVADLLGAL